MITSINRITTHPIDTDLLDRLGINSSSKVANPKVGGKILQLARAGYTKVKVFIGEDEYGRMEINYHCKKVEEELGVCMVKFVNIDSFNRPVFRDAEGNYYGCTEELFPYETSEQEVLDRIDENDLVFFGRKFCCEPMGTTVTNLKIVRR
jgi:hypothetical protein